MYKSHWDNANMRWNVFDEKDNYVTNFKLIKDADEYCEKKNKELHAKSSKA